MDNALPRSGDPGDLGDGGDLLARSAVKTPVFGCVFPTNTGIEYEGQQLERKIA